MSDKVFLDTNVLIYAIETDGPDPRKSSMARSLVDRAGATLSVQVLGEFYRAVTSARRRSPLTHNEAVAWIQFWKGLEIQPISVAHVDLALELAGRFQIGYFDALILAAARFAKCEVLFSEDLNDRQDYGGVRVENPFKDDLKDDSD